MNPNDPTAQKPYPFGKHKGKALIDVPASYLLWAYNNVDWEQKPQLRWLKIYIYENMADLQQAASKEEFTEKQRHGTREYFRKKYGKNYL